jgi:prefoldin subunit 5
VSSVGTSAPNVIEGTITSVSDLFEKFDDIKELVKSVDELKDACMEIAESRKALREAKEDLETVKTAASNSGSEMAHKGKYGYAILHYISHICC